MAISENKRKRIRLAKQEIAKLQEEPKHATVSAFQRAPRKNSARYRHDGKSQTLAEWAREKNIPYQILYNRIHIHGWEPKRAIATPYRENGAKSTLPKEPLAKQPLSVKVPASVDEAIRSLPDDERINLLRNAIIQAAKQRFPDREDWKWKRF